LIRVLLEFPSDSERARFARMLASDAELQVVQDGELADVIIAGNSEERHPGDSWLMIVLEQADQPHVAQALRAGARGVVPIHVAAPELAAAVRAVYHGWVITPPERLPPAQPEPLTARELEVLRLLADGSSNKEIAARLAISEHTVKFHVNSILGKLGAGSRTEAVTVGLRSGLIML
jgi:DNA-binding NarL/FixJ family response regulator